MNTQIGQQSRRIYNILRTFSIFRYNFEQINNCPLVINTAGARFGGKFSKKISEREGVGGFTLGGETALDGLSDGGGIRGN
ncbi:hypothetical protein CISIN_1g034891mg [Citrus sinensis]|uniref:Uncharacterized protein n=1 Tax=Citrus sinensis TaxID=2711 RepID=A0A067FU23_CITSI|nr:hypothetical protein CISIN_1g034891mg [Citrus sinensis]